MIAIIDYGMGNLRSVAKAVEHLGAAAQITQDPAEVAAATKVILPGVGAFPMAMHELRTRGLIDPLKRALAAGMPYLGVCLGLQLLFDTSDEGEGSAGLGVLPGRVKRFDASKALKIPHMGWNSVQRSDVRGQRSEGGSARECPLLQGIPDGSFFYFVHSYYAEPTNSTVTALESDYGTRFTAMIWRKNLFATQFHPEKSQALGLQLLDNFLKL